MRIDTQLKTWSDKAYGVETQTPVRISLIMAYEVADVMRAANRMDSYPQDYDRYLSYARTGIEDTLAMAQLLCTILGIDFEKAHTNGCERAIMRCEDKLDGLTPED